MTVKAKFDVNKIRRRAKALSNLMETAQRASNGQTYWQLKDCSKRTSRFFYDMAHHCHTDSDGTQLLPNDYIYRWIVSALADIGHEYAMLGETMDECVRNCTEDGTLPLAAWMASHLWRVCYVEEELREMPRTDMSLVEAMRQAQEKEILRVYRVVWYYLDNEY